MGRSFALFCLAIMLSLCAAAATACGADTDFGVLTIADITVRQGESAPIEPQFSRSEGVSDILYTFEGDDIAIADGTVTGLRESVTVVAAKSAHHVTSFRVTVTAPDRGTLTIADMAIAAEGTAEIEPAFSSAYGESDIVYTFEGDNIRIDGNTITPLVADSVTEVTATSAYHTVVFTVTVHPSKYGVMTIEAPEVLYYNYPAKALSVEFSDPAYASDVAFTSDDPCVTIEDNTIRAAGNFTEAKTVRVTAVSEYHTAEFTVRTERFDGANASGASLSLESRVNALLQDWTARGGETDGVLFVGDSFFDTRSYWTDFYTTYGRKNAFSVGISATTTTDWEILSERLVYPLAPAAVVVHCGTNNIFDDGKTGAEAAEDIIRLFGLIGHNLPDAEIYYFGIEPRVGRPTADVIACNAAVAEYCGWEDNLTYLDSPAFCSDPDGNAVADFFKDGVHPKPENYIYYVDALDEAGLTFAPSAAASVTEIAAFTTALSDTIASSREIIYRAMPLREEYVLTGKVDITDIAANAHMQFRFDGNDNRFLLWDANIAGATSDNRFGLGWKCGSAAYVTEEARYTFTPGETLTIGFRLIVSEHNAYFYFYDTAQSAYVMEAVFMNVPVAENLLVGTEFMAARVYDLSALTKLDDPVAYAAALASAGIDAYESAAAPGTVLYAGSAPDGSYVLRADEPLPEPIEVTDNFTLFGKNESQSAFTGTERDYVLVQDGESGISGDFAFTYDVTILDSDMTEQTSVSQNSHNWFYVVTASPVSGRGIWNDGYHLLYWKKNAADAAIVSYRTGETLRQGMTALSFTAVTVRSGDTLTLAMVFDDGTRVEKTVDVSGVGALTLWLGGSDANFRITDAVFSRDAADIAAALGQSV